MLTNNGKKLLHLTLGGGSPYINAGSSNSANSYQCINGSSQICFLQYIIASDCARICFGTNDSISSDMYTLENITYENPDTQNRYFTIVGQYVPSFSNNVSTQSFVVKNTTNDTLTYRCFGRTICGSQNYQSAPDYLALVAVYMLDKPVTIPAGESRTIVVSMDVNEV